MNKEPFFIIGSPRSGTTILRDVIKLDNKLDCPEETFFYRWSEPFASKIYTKTYFNNKVVVKHRELDGISDLDFEMLYESSKTRKEFQDGYMKLFLRNKGVDEEIRWFDKTPQNVFGLLLLSHDYPKSKFLHIYRHPLNVVASLCMGRSLAKHSLKGALNTWKESIALATSFKKLYPDRILEIKYEDFIYHPNENMKAIGNHINHDFSNLEIPEHMIGHGGNKRYEEAFNEEEVDYIIEMCADEMINLEYEKTP